MLGFFLILRALVMIPPSVAATLRTGQIVVAFVAQVLINNTIPGVVDVLGAAFIFLAAMVVTFEVQIYKGIEKCCFCDCCRPQVSATIRASEEAINVAEDIRPQAPGRIRTVSHSLS